MAQTINLTIGEKNGLLTLEGAPPSLGTQFDNEAFIFQFTRPTDRAQEDLFLIFEPERDTGKETVSLGKGNSFAVTSALTQRTRLRFQAALVNGARRRELSDILSFTLRASLPAAAEDPEPWPPTTEEG